MSGLRPPVVPLDPRPNGDFRHNREISILVRYDERTVEIDGRTYPLAGGTVFFESADATAPYAATAAIEKCHITGDGQAHHRFATDATPGDPCLCGGTEGR